MPASNHILRMSKEERSAYMAELGRKGGSVKSPAKTAAVRMNGRKGRYCKPGTIRSIDDPPVWGVRYSPREAEEAKRKAQEAQQP
jgi:hypothetical protein